MSWLAHNGKRYWFWEPWLPVSPPWIYHNERLGLISMSADWNTWYTIMDKNLWATTVFNTGDTLSEANCWNYFQWWNNYGFAWTGAVTTSNTKVDASTYWPWNHYSSSTFITVSESPYDWSSVQNDNLWWWVTGTNEAMQWPAPTWYHIPSKDERVTLCSILTSTFWLTGNTDTMESVLKMPRAGYRHYSSAGVYYQGTYANYWSSTAYTADTAYSLFFYSAGLSPQGGSGRSFGLSVRCFKDTPVIPTGKWKVLYRGSL